MAMNTKINHNKSLSYLDILFENRNKAYGSYELRKNYSSRLKNAMVILITLFGILLLASKTEKGTAEIEIKPKNTRGPIICTTVVVIAKPKPPKNPTTKANLPKTPKVTLPKVPHLTIPKIVANQLVTAPAIQQPVVPNPIAANNTTSALISTPTSETPGNATPNNGKPTFGNEGGSATNKNNGIASTVDQAPAFPGGEVALTAFLNKHLEYPEEAKANGVEGTVIIEFVVDEDGAIRQIRSDNKESYGIVAEGKRVVGMMPKWQPGMVAGNPVKCYFSVPIVYELSDLQ
jgi:protein TonB